jgi:hypothetical protein
MAYFFKQARPEQVLAALETHLEIMILDAFMEHVRNKLNEPLNSYRYIISI